MNFTHTHTRVLNTHTHTIVEFSLLVFRMLNVRLKHMKFRFHRLKAVPLSTVSHGSTYHCPTFFLNQFAYLFIHFWPHSSACGILVPQLGIKPMPPAVEAQGLSHFTSWVVLKYCPTS